MNKEGQLEQLRQLLINPELKSGLYLLDTDISDEDIGRFLNDGNFCRYVCGQLISSAKGNIFDLLVVGLSHQCADSRINDLRDQLILADDRNRETIIYSLAIHTLKFLSAGEKILVRII